MGYYPMLVATRRTTDVVRGMVITVDTAQYEAVQQRLDSLEGYDPGAPTASAYQRQMVDVVLANGRSRTAWVYLGQTQFVQGKPVVSSGDWVAYTAGRQSILKTWWQSINTVAGLHNKQ